MIPLYYGVKVIHTTSVGSGDRRFYEELILAVRADSPEEAYEKAEAYMQGYDFVYTNIYGEPVRTVKIEAVDCFVIYPEEGEVQEVYSAFSMNRSPLPEKEYYRLISTSCDEEDLRPLRNGEFA